MPRDTYKDPVEKKYEKVSIYLSQDEKKALMDVIGEKKLSSVLRVLIIQYILKQKSGKNGS
jgi:hypothetical protein